MAATGTFAINNVSLLYPTTHKWLERTILDKSGDGHMVYPAKRTYELRWNLMTPATFNQLQVAYNSVGTTGTLVVSLPEQGAATYEFKNYTGCVVSEPYYGTYFDEHYTDVIWVVDVPL